MEKPYVCVLTADPDIEEFVCPRCNESVTKLIPTSCGLICRDCDEEIDDLGGDDPYAKNYWAEERCEQQMAEIKNGDREW